MEDNFNRNACQEYGLHGWKQLSLEGFIGRRLNWVEYTVGWDMRLPSCKAHRRFQGLTRKHPVWMYVHIGLETTLLQASAHKCNADGLCLIKRFSN
jgi:hypothetical protein